MTAALTAFLAARLDDDERVAVAANQGAWRIDETLDDRAVVCVGHPTAANAVTVLFEADWGTMDDARHIAHYHPDRVIREVTAKRAVVALHKPRALERWKICARCRPVDPAHPSDSTTELWPCSTLRQMAAVYSDHPDYRQEWKPA